MSLVRLSLNTRVDLETRVLAAALKQSFERGDSNGVSLAHRMLHALLREQSGPSVPGLSTTTEQTPYSATGDQMTYTATGDQVTYGATGDLPAYRATGEHASYSGEHDEPHDYDTQATNGQGSEYGSNGAYYEVHDTNFDSGHGDGEGLPEEFDQAEMEDIYDQPTSTEELQLEEELDAAAMVVQAASGLSNSDFESPGAYEEAQQYEQGHGHEQEHDFEQSHGSEQGHGREYVHEHEQSHGREQAHEHEQVHDHEYVHEIEHEQKHDYGHENDYGHEIEHDHDHVHGVAHDQQSGHVNYQTLDENTTNYAQASFDPADSNNPSVHAVEGMHEADEWSAETEAETEAEHEQIEQAELSEPEPGLIQSEFVEVAETEPSPIEAALGRRHMQDVTQPLPNIRGGITDSDIIGSITTREERDSRSRSANNQDETAAHLQGESFESPAEEFEAVGSEHHERDSDGDGGAEDDNESEAKSGSTKPIIRWMPLYQSTQDNVALEADSEASHTSTGENVTLGDDSLELDLGSSEETIPPHAVKVSSIHDLSIISPPVQFDEKSSPGTRSSGSDATSSPVKKMTTTADTPISKMPSYWAAPPSIAAKLQNQPSSGSAPAKSASTVTGETSSFNAPNSALNEEYQIVNESGQEAEKSLHRHLSDKTEGGLQGEATAVDVDAIPAPVIEVKPRREDLYEYLGVSQMTSNHNIHTKALRKIRKLLREIKAAPNSQKKEMLKELRRLWVANDILTDPVTRNDYDFRDLGLRGDPNAPAPQEDKSFTAFGARSTLRIGELLQCAGLLETAELEIACDMHRAMPEMQFGTFLVKQGFIQERDLESVLVGQKLLRKGTITVAQFQVAMELSQSRGLSITQTLFEKGYLKESDYAELEESERLEKQAAEEAPVIREIAIQPKQIQTTSDTTDKQSLASLLNEASNQSGQNKAVSKDASGPAQIDWAPPTPEPARPNTATFSNIPSMRAPSSSPVSYQIDWDSPSDAPVEPVSSKSGLHDHLPKIQADKEQTPIPEVQRLQAPPVETKSKQPELREKSPWTVSSEFPIDDSDDFFHPKVTTAEAEDRKLAAANRIGEDNSSASELVEQDEVTAPGEVAEPDEVAAPDELAAVDEVEAPDENTVNEGTEPSHTNDFQSDAEDDGEDFDDTASSESDTLSGEFESFETDSDNVDTDNIHSDNTDSDDTYSGEAESDNGQPHDANVAADDLESGLNHSKSGSAGQPSKSEGSASGKPEGGLFRRATEMLLGGKKTAEPTDTKPGAVSEEEADADVDAQRSSQRRRRLDPKKDKKKKRR